MIRVSKILVADSWGDYIRGEYWLNPDGSSDYADGDLGDKGHESIAAEAILGNKSFELEQAFINYFKNVQATADPTEFQSELRTYKDYFPQGSQDIEEFSLNNSSMDGSAGDIFWSPGIPHPVGEAVFGVEGWNEINEDIREYYMKHFGTAHVIDNNFGVWLLTPKLIEAIKDFLYERASENGEEENLDGTINIEEISTRRWASDIEVAEFMNMKYPGQVFAGVRAASRKVATLLEVWMDPSGKTYDAAPNGHVNWAGRNINLISDRTMDKEEANQEFLIAGWIRLGSMAGQTYMQALDLNSSLLGKAQQWVQATQQGNYMTVQIHKLGIIVVLSIEEFLILNKPTDLKRFPQLHAAFNKKAGTQDGWLLPDGSFNKVNSGEFHRDVAQKTFGKMKDPGRVGVDRSAYNKEANSSYFQAMKSGWIRVTADGLDVDVWTDEKLHRAQKFIMESNYTKSHLYLDSETEQYTTMPTEDFLVLNRASQLRKRPLLIASKVASEWGKFVSNEFWLNVDGTLTKAYSTDNLGHKELALQEILGPLEDSFQKVLPNYYDPMKDTDYETFESTLETYYINGKFTLKGSHWLEFDGLFEFPGIPLEAGREVMGAAWDELVKDPVKYYMKHYPVAHIVNNNFSTWHLSPRLLEALKKYVLINNDLIKTSWKNLLYIEEMSSGSWADGISVEEFLVCKYAAQIFRQGI